MVDAVQATEQSADLPALPESTALDPSAIEARELESKGNEQTPPQQEDDKETKKVVSSVQKRIDELTRARHDTERQAQEQIQHWQRIAWEESQRAQQFAQQRQQMELQSSEPTLEGSGNDFEKYLANRAAWEAKRNQAQFQAQWAAQQQHQQGLAAQQAQQAAMQAQQQQQFLAEQQFVKQKVAEGSKAYKDFEAVVSNPELPVMRSINPAAYHAILQSEKGIDVAYYIAKNPLLAHKIAIAPPMQAVLEIGRIEGMFQAGNRVTNAPAPPSNVTHKGTGEASNTPDDKMSMDEWVAKRNKQIRASR